MASYFPKSNHETIGNIKLSRLFLSGDCSYASGSLCFVFTSSWFVFSPPRVNCYTNYSDIESR